MGDLSTLYGQLIGQQLGPTEEVDTQPTSNILFGDPVDETQPTSNILFGDPVDDSSLNLAPTRQRNLQVSQASSVPVSPDLIGFRNMDIANRLGRA